MNIIQPPKIFEYEYKYYLITQKFGLQIQILFDNPKNLNMNMNIIQPSKNSKNEHKYYSTTQKF